MQGFMWDSVKIALKVIWYEVWQ